MQTTALFSNECRREKIRIPRLRVLALSLAVAATLSLLAASCTNSRSQVRVVNAIPNAPSNVDVVINGSTLFKNAGFPSVSPSSGYQSLSVGTEAIELLQTGTTNVVINSSVSLASGQSTVLVAGLYGATSGTNEPSLQAVSDNNSAPQTGDVEFRIVDASPSAPSSVDVYIVAPGTNIAPLSPNISALAYPHASSYQTLPTGTYSVVATTSGSKVPFVNQQYSLVAGQIRTLVIVDVSGSGSPSSTPLELSDLN